ncbi:U-box domain-containing protein 15 [Linum grandiflorum]
MNEDETGSGRGSPSSSSEEGFESTSPRDGNDDHHVVDSILRVIESVARLGGYRGTHHRECIALVRRMKTFLPFLEEVRDFETTTPISEEGIGCLKNLKATFVVARKLLRICNEGSKIYLAAEREAVTERFKAVHEKLFNVLESMPYDELGISDEVREQVDLMKTQLKRPNSNRHSDSQDMELAIDLMFVLSKKDDQSNSDSAIIERIARKLELHDVENVKNETIAVRNLVRERGGIISGDHHDDETLQHIIAMLNKMRKMVGLEESCDLNCDRDGGATKSLSKSPSLIIPHEFLCPITLEIMVDPVIIASGQVAIGLCDGIPPLVDLLQRGTMRGKKDALTALFNLCLNDSNKEKAIEAGIVDPLLQLLKDRNLNMIDETLSIFLLLASHPEGRNAVGQLPFIEMLVGFMAEGTPKNKECATSVLLELGSGNSNYMLMALQFGAYEHLVEMSESGTDRGKRKANSLIQLMSKSEQL